jgi:transcription initiation factor TFIID subunit 2
MANTWTGTLATLSFFRRVFMSTNSTLTSTNTTTSSTNTSSSTSAITNIVRINDFSNSQMYMIQKTIPQAIALQRNKDRVCPPEVIHFLFELIHYNENSKNRFSDAFYRSSLIDSLGNTLTNIGLTNTTTITNVEILLNHTLDNNTKRIFDEILLQINFDKIIPSYGFCVTCSCLRVLHKLNIISGIPIDINVFYEYAVYGMFDRVRLTACEILVEQIESRILKNFLKKISFFFCFCSSNESRCI